MEKHKLIKIILKDLEELNEIASELSASEELSKLELDIALSKSKLVYQEFEFLNELSKQIINNTPNENLTVSSPVIPESKVVEEVQNKVTNEEEAEQVEVADEKPEFREVEDKESEQTDVAVATTEEELATAETQPSPTQSAPEEDGEESEDDETGLKKTVGEHFVKGKSLNDFLIEGKTLDQKLASSPIDKLESAIGLNDRFQFTRELFDNNADLFKSTVQYIDQSTNLDEAVAFLNSNFKWKKTGTSIQFAQLIKRRFSK